MKRKWAWSALFAVVAMVAIWGLRIEVQADGGYVGVPYWPPKPPAPVRVTISVPVAKPAPRFERPYEIWEKYKDRFGFGSSQETGNLPPPEQLDALKKKLADVIKEYSTTKDNEAKIRLKKEQSDIEKDIAMAGIVPKGATAAERRAGFIEDTVDALVLLLGGNDTGDLPDFRCSRPQIIADLEKILKEIGKDAGPVLWKILSEQVRFRTADGPARKQEFEGRIAELKQEIYKLSDEISKSADPEERKKLHERRSELNDRIGGLDRAVAVVQRCIGGVNQPIIDKLEKLLLDMGPEDAVPVLLIGANEKNPAASQEAVGLIAKMGAKAVPLLIAGLKDEKTFRSAARALKQVTRQDLGDAPEAWADWYEKAGKERERPGK